MRRVLTTSLAIGAIVAGSALAAWILGGAGLAGGKGWAALNDCNSIVATTLPPGSEATFDDSAEPCVIGVPRGDVGAQGDPGLSPVGSDVITNTTHCTTSSSVDGNYGSAFQVGTNPSTYACNGRKGDTGNVGPAPTVSSEPSGANCANGGAKIQGSGTAYACTGNTGGQGPAGADAPLSAAYQKTSTAPGNVTSFSFSCNSGDSVIGGGPTTVSTGKTLVASYPSASDTWTVTWSAAGAGSATWVVSIMCARRATLSSSSASGNGTATATCSATQILIGGGAVANSGNLTSSFPNASGLGGSWRGTSSAALTNSVTAWVLCE